MPPLSDADSIDTDIAFVPVHIAVLTVSDTRTRTTTFQATRW